MAAPPPVLQAPPGTPAKAPAGATHPAFHAAYAGGAYFLAAMVGLAFVAEPEHIATVWPASGVLLASLLLVPARSRAWVAGGTFVAIVAANLVSGNSAPLSAALAGANLAEGLAAAALLGLAEARGLLRLRGAARLVFLAAPAACALGAVLGAATMATAAGAPAVSVWTTWWVADYLGMLLVAPALVAWLARPGPPGAPTEAAHQRRALAEALALGAVCGGATAVVFTGQTALGAYAVIPGLVAASLRLGPRGATACAALVAVVALAGTLAGVGSLAVGRGDALGRVVSTQAFLVVAAATALLGQASAYDARAANAALRASEGSARALADTAQDAIISADLRGRITYWNPAAERMFGHAAAAVLGQPLILIIPERHRSSHRAAFSRAAGGGPMLLQGRAVELEGLRSDGTEFPLELSLARTHGPAGEGFTAILRDLTERRAAEGEARRAFERDQELRRLQAIDEFKTRFINMAAHELRTPLTPLKLQLDLLARDPARANPRTLAILERNLARLDRLVEDLLDAARIQAGRLELRPARVGLRGPLAEVTEVYGPLASAAGVSLEVPDPGPIEVAADEGRLAQVLSNLVANAVRFTPAGGSVRVSAAVEDGAAVVRVRDTGVGLREDQLGRLFQPFAQVHDGGESRGGTGLGLYISKGIVEQHGGRIWAESAGPGKGSTFAFALPLARRGAQGDAEGDAQGTAAATAGAGAPRTR